MFRPPPPAHLLLCFSPHAGTPQKADDEPSHDSPGCLAGGPPTLTSAVTPVLTASSHTKPFPPSQPAGRGRAASLSGQGAKCTQQNAFKPSGDQKIWVRELHKSPGFLIRSLAAAACACSRGFPLPVGCERGGGGDTKQGGGGCLPKRVMVGGSAGTRPINGMGSVCRA